jgi:hypothetical protein
MQSGAFRQRTFGWNGGLIRCDVDESAVAIPASNPYHDVSGHAPHFHLSIWSLVCPSGQSDKIVMPSTACLPDRISDEPAVASSAALFRASSSLAPSELVG